ncbi:hypothetical protein QPK87_04820 [Kamptonema cortianum]|nr:hypothetical protein [Geitlerinema splendidum]MDK3155899.1 hypothetical protein [Kamptonema cortianum]
MIQGFDLVESLLFGRPGETILSSEDEPQSADSQNLDMRFEPDVAAELDIATLFEGESADRDGRESALDWIRFVIAEFAGMRR